MLSQLCYLKDICALGLPLLILPLLEVRGKLLAACCDFGRDLNCSPGALDLDPSPHTTESYTAES